MNDDSLVVPEGYKLYPALEKACLALPKDGTVMETLFADPGEQARAANALSKVATQILVAYMPEVFASHVVGTPFWVALCEALSETGVRSMALGVYLGQTGTAKLKLED